MLEMIFDLTVQQKFQTDQFFRSAVLCLEKKNMLDENYQESCFV